MRFFGLPHVAALLLALIVGAGLVAAPDAIAQPTPFGVPAAPSAAPEAPSGEQGIVSELSNRLIALQRKLHGDLGEAIGRIKTERWTAGLLTLIGLSFLYGVVHAAGPGHGKAVISSYVLANQETLRRGVILSFVSAIAQAATAVALVGLLAAILNASGAAITGWTNWLETASYALLAALGLYLLARQIARALAQLGFRAEPRLAHAHAGHGGHDRHGHDHGGHDHSCCGHSHAPPPEMLTEKVTFGSMAAVVAAVGLRPCTGAILVLVFALAQGIFWAGVAATFVMALGTAITVSALAALAVTSRDAAMRFAGAGSGWGAALWTGISVAGAGAIFLFGAAMMLASLGPSRPF
jgi:nickel/cobalt exporter